MRYCSRTDVGKVRRKNEDVLHADGRVFAVADGMGGHRGGEVASATAVEAVTDAVGAGPADANVSRLLAGAIVSANDEIYQKAHTGSGPPGMGTTLTCGVLSGDTLVIGHIGDSRAYLLRDGNLKQLTEDHSLVGELFRNGQITKEQAFDHPSRNVLTQALGTSTEVAPQVATHKLTAGDRVLLCSDGLTTMLTDDEIAKTLLDEADVATACRALVDTANKAGGADNISVVLLDFADPDPFSVEKAVSADPARRKKSGCGRAVALILVVAALALILAGFASLRILNNTYYLGVSKRHRVTIFRGVPGSFGGLSYSRILEETTVTSDQLRPTSKRLVEDNTVVGDLDTVLAAIRRLEMVAPPLDQPPGTKPGIKPGTSPPSV